MITITVNNHDINNNNNNDINNNNVPRSPHARKRAKAPLKSSHEGDVLSDSSTAPLLCAPCTYGGENSEARPLIACKILITIT